jgi:hypothetical protein
MLTPLQLISGTVWPLDWSFSILTHDNKRTGTTINGATEGDLGIGIGREGLAVNLQEGATCKITGMCSLRRRVGLG